jgi:hypothetical protein
MEKNSEKFDESFYSVDEEFLLSDINSDKFNEHFDEIEPQIKIIIDKLKIMLDTIHFNKLSKHTIYERIKKSIYLSLDKYHTHGTFVNIRGYFAKIFAIHYIQHFLKLEVVELFRAFLIIDKYQNNNYSSQRQKFTPIADLIIKNKNGDHIIIKIKLSSLFLKTNNEQTRTHLNRLKNCFYCMPKTVKSMALNPFVSKDCDNPDIIEDKGVVFISGINNFVKYIENTNNDNIKKSTTAVLTQSCLDLFMMGKRNEYTIYQSYLVDKKSYDMTYNWYLNNGNTEKCTSLLGYVKDGTFKIIDRNALNKTFYEDLSEDVLDICCDCFDGLYDDDINKIENNRFSFCVAMALNLPIFDSNTNITNKLNRKGEIFCVCHLLT